MVNVFIRQPIFAIVLALSTQIIAIFDGCDAAVAAVAFPDETTPRPILSGSYSQQTACLAVPVFAGEALGHCRVMPDPRVVGLGDLYAEEDLAVRGLLSALEQVDAQGDHRITPSRSREQGRGLFFSSRQYAERSAARSSPTTPKHLRSQLDRFGYLSQNGSLAKTVALSTA